MQIMFIAISTISVTIPKYIATCVPDKKKEEGGGVESFAFHVHIVHVYQIEYVCHTSSD
jgi:hypothetical protein